MSRYKDITGERFGLLVVAEYLGNDAKGKVLWRSVCDCGGVKITRAENLIGGSTRSCGCLAIEQRRNAAQRQSHAMSKTSKPREHDAWAGMIRRCYDPKHPSFVRYGNAGISVCDDWRESFANFYNDMGECPIGYTLDRIDNRKNYLPDNCRWASRKQQANNRSSNRLLTHDGVAMNISQWSEFRGWHKSVIASRLFIGWDVDRALTQEPRERHR